MCAKNHKQIKKKYKKNRDVEFEKRKNDDIYALQIPYV